MKETSHARTEALLRLQPGFFEFTGTKGLLRVLQSSESWSRAQGLLFLCPRCKHSKQKQHYNIFIFDFPGIPQELKPRGRFTPKMVRQEKTDTWVPAPFQMMTLQNLNGPKEAAPNLLVPGDVRCGWKGTLLDGVVSWMPSLLERWRG